jgi:hypothetical protein
MMTPERAMAEVAVFVYNQHVSDHQYHASLGASGCVRCERLGEAASVLQEQATASVGLAQKEVRT